MSEEQNIAATGGPRAVVIGTQTYLASPLNDMDNGTLLDWVKKRLQSPLLAVADDFDKLPPLMQEKVIKAAVELKTAGGAMPNSESYRQQLMTPAGCAFLAWVMVRKEHPTVTLEALRKDITDENYVDVLAGLTEAAGLGSLGKATGATGSTGGPNKTAPPSTET